MFCRRRLVVLLSLIGLYGAAQNSSAQMDPASQNLLIEKLDKVYQQLPGQDASKVSVTLRLADLYADRARIESMHGGNPAKDRQKALRLYNEVLERAPEASRAKIILQIGHLYQMNGDDDKAITFYQKNLSQQNDPAMLAEAHLSLAEIHFKRRDWTRAIQHYNSVLEQPKTASRGLAAYRRAWCLLHQGKTSQAIGELASILNQPELLSRGAHQQQDNQFQEEVARDYSTFIAKDLVTEERVDSLLKLSPESTRVTNTQALAFELERLGKKDEALLVWSKVADLISQPIERLAAHISIAQLHLDKGAKEQALKSYEFAMQSWGDIGFNDNPYEQELKRRARNFAIAWNQIEKKQPSIELLSAYEAYLKIFSKDTDAHLYSAQIAFSHKNWPVAWIHFSSALELLSQESNQTQKIESTLLSQVEVAEAMQDPSLRRKAYMAYLEKSSIKSKETEVRYQAARLTYDQGDFANAAIELRHLALLGKSSLHRQAANLSLDALVLLKDENRLIAWAREFQKVYPEGHLEFGQILQKTILTQSATIAEQDPSAALALLKEFDPNQSTPEDRIRFYKNKLILAEKQGQIHEASSAADALTNLTPMSAEDREFAWSRKAYFAELRLDFATAFAATEKLEKTLSIEEKNFKLAVFAELSGRPSSTYYMNYLAQTADAERKILVAAELVRKSKTPEKELQKVHSILNDSPSLLAQLYAETYATTGKEALIRAVSQEERLAKTDAGRLLKRQDFLKKFKQLSHSIAGDQLESKSQKKLAQSIKRRAALLEKVEELAKQAIQDGDWTSQLLSIDLLARQSERFYQDLFGVPVPTGLSPQEEQEYLTLLSAQANPFQAKASEAKTKSQQFWKDSDWLNPLKTSWEQQRLRPLIEIEIQALKQIAPEEQLMNFDNFKLVKAMIQRPQLKEIQDARQRVFENPLDKKALENLLLLERKSDNSSMSEYLASRIERLEKGAL